MDTGAAEKRQITRNRASYSCQTCRRRKVKCDKVHPVCGGCRKINEICVYGQPNARSSPAGDNATRNSSTSGIKRRKSVLEPDERPDTSAFSESQWSTKSASRLEALEDQIERLSALVEAIREQEASQSSPRDMLTPISPQSQRESDEDARSRDYRASPATRGHGRQSPEVAGTGRPFSRLTLTQPEQEQHREHPDIFWSTIADEVDQLNLLLRGAGRYLSSTNIANENCEVQDTILPLRNLPTDKNTKSVSHNHEQDHPQTRTDPDKLQDCEVCLSAASDKPIFLCGSDSKLLLPNSRLDLLAGIPTEEQSHVLFRCWLSGINPTIPLVPLQDMFRKYEAFWQWHRDYSKGRNAEMQSPDMLFMPLLYAILYAGSQSMSLQGLRRWFPNVSRTELSTNLHRQVIRYLSFISFPSHVALPSLAAFTILQLVPVTQDEHLQTTTYMNLIIRVAQMHGLHREPSVFELPPFESEMRRRLWWHIICMDTGVAVSSGHPPLLADEYFDTRIASEVKLAKIGTKQAAEYLEEVEKKIRPPDTAEEPLSGNDATMVSVSSMVGRAMAMSAVVLRKVLRTHLATGQLTKDRMTETYGMLGSLGKELGDIISRIPSRGLPESDFTPDITDTKRASNGDCESILGTPPRIEEIMNYLGTPSPGLEPGLASFHRQKITAFHKYARVFISLMKDKAHCVTYAPFLKNAKSKLWSSARQCALHHCHAYMRKYISLGTDPAFIPFRWSWSRMHQPMHAALIILIDLHERPDAVEAPRSRELIDKVFSLSDPESGIVGGPNGVSQSIPMREGGLEAWNMLRGLRDRAWRNAKLDPGFLWTQADQIKVGVAKPLTHDQKIAQSIREDSIYQGDEKEADSSTESVASGVRYVMNLVQGMGSSDVSELKTSSFHQSTEDAISDMQKTQPRCTALARLEGQQKMPFPLELSSSFSCCSKPANTGNGAVDSVNVRTYDGRRAGERGLGVHGLMFPNQDPPLDRQQHPEISQPTDSAALTEPYLASNTRPDSDSNPSTNLFGFISQQIHQANQWRNPSNVVVASDPKSNSESNGKTKDHPFPVVTKVPPLSKSGTKPLVNGYHNNSIIQGLSSQELQKSSDPGQIKPASTDQTSTNNTNKINENLTKNDSSYNNGLDFDWDRWDAVFGQYSGFTDLMEDVNWEISEQN